MRHGTELFGVANMFQMSKKKKKKEEAAEAESSSLAKYSRNLSPFLLDWGSRKRVFLGVQREGLEGGLLVKQAE